MKRFISVTVFTGALCFSMAAFAAPSCPENFADGAKPVVLNKNLTNRLTQICYRGFSLEFSGVTHTPLWSAEYLTPERVELSHKMKRKDSFHTEARLPLNDRTQINDFAGTCMDKGHMVPSGDAPDADAMDDTFSMANMIPQNPVNNQVLWGGVEKSVKAMVGRRGPMYVVTGPMFEGNTIKTISGRILVPTSVYKAVYDRTNGQAGAYVSANSADHDLTVISVAQLEQRIGINLFPTMPANIKATAMQLPAPRKTNFDPTSRPRKGCTYEDMHGGGESASAQGQQGPVAASGKAFPTVRDATSGNVDYEKAAKAAEKAAMTGLKYFLKH